MNTHYLQFTTGEKFQINEKEAMGIARASDDQSITIKRLGMVVQKRMVQIYPINAIADRSKQITGILHDGTMVKRYFGQWVDANNEGINDHGKYVPIQMNPDYYPEIRRDIIATPEEFATIKLRKENYYEFLGIDTSVKITGSTGLEHIGDGIKNKLEKKDVK